MIRYNQKELEKDISANCGRIYQQCSISVMDTIADPDISFDENGICNYYYEYKKAAESHVFNGRLGEEKLKAIVNLIKKNGKGKKYDCITGVSGGVDSTFLALQAKKLGLRPLIIHFDNGWNSETAVQNVQNIVNKLDFDLHTLVVDWEEFKDVQLSFIKASVVDIEAITDFAIYSTLLKLAVKHNIKYVLSGNNIITEQVLPKSWIYKDDKNLIDIHRRFGTRKIKTLPLFSRNKMRFINKWYGIEVIELLNYMDYNKELVKKTITQELEWRDYGGKHYESIFTRFYQGYILPNKFKIDKRKAHLSNLIFSGQMTKDQAVLELDKPIYSKEMEISDKDFVLKKLGLSELEFERLMALPPKSHKEFEYTKPFFVQYPYLKIFKPLWNLINSKED